MRRIGWLLVALVPLLAQAEWAAGETIRHSGTILAVDEEGGTLLLAEVGPWRATDAAAVTRYAVKVTPHTMFVLARRQPSHTTWPGGFVEGTTEAWTVKTGDFATVLCVHEGRSATALEIVVTVVGEP